MTDDIKSINIINHSIQVPKLNGHTKIELAGAREKEVIEHENHMTDIIEKLLDAYGTWMCPGEVLNMLTPATSKLYGGLLLTDKAIDDDALVLPGGTEVTACGSYEVVNDTSATTLGNYNKIESVYDVDAAKMTYVYDWDTSKGNGVIAAAALTNAKGGLCGYGDANLGNYQQKGYIVDYDSNISYYQKQPDNMPVLMVTDDYMICATYSSSTLTLYRISSNVKSIQALPAAQPAGIEYSKYIKKEFANVANLTSSLPSYTDGQNIYLAAGSTTSKNGTLTLYKINNAASDTPALETIQITNNTGCEIYQNSGFEIYNNYLYITTFGGGALCEINVTNPVDTNVYNANIPKYSTINHAANMGSGKIYITNGGSNYGAIVFDTATKTVKQTMLKGLQSAVVNKSIFPIFYNRDSKYAARGIPNFYLATINNLDSPVTKTADKTMKVTYTIQAV